MLNQDPGATASIHYLRLIRNRFVVATDQKGNTRGPYAQQPFSICSWGIPRHSQARWDNLSNQSYLYSSHIELFVPQELSHGSSHHSKLLCYKGSGTDSSLACDAEMLAWKGTMPLPELPDTQARQLRLLMLWFQSKTASGIQLWDTLESSLFHSSLLIIISFSGPSPSSPWPNWIMQMLAWRLFADHNMLHPLLLIRGGHMITDVLCYFAQPGAVIKV